MDFVGLITPPSSAGNRYILTISDYFTQFGWAKVLPTKEAKGVVAALKEVIINVLLGGKMIYSHSLYLAIVSDGNSAQNLLKKVIPVPGLDDLLGSAR